MKISTEASLLSPSRSAARLLLQAGAAAAAVALVAFSAVIAKNARSAPLLASVRAERAGAEAALVPVSAAEAGDLTELAITAEAALEPEPEAVAETMDEPGPVDADAGGQADVPDEPAADPLTLDPNVRWFNGRPVRPTRVITMIVTAYSPDARSCGDSADGITATLHSVETNASKLVAADPRVLSYGSMITVPGYDSDRIVPVLDCGSAIKGRRLDVLFPTHEAARQWGVRKIPVTVWAYADGKPAENPRHER